MPSSSFILNVETATEVCSVSLCYNGKIVAIREQDSGMVHSEKLAIFIQEIISEAGISSSLLSAIAISSGPGSYTGLRIATALAKGMCYPLNIPLISVNTLESMAALFIDLNPDLAQNTLICPMLDARRSDVYTATFDLSGKTIIGSQCITLDENSSSSYLISNPVIFIGDGAEKASRHILNTNAKFIPSFKCSSRGMLKLSEQKFLKKEFEDLLYFEPKYLKEAFITKSK